MSNCSIIWEYTAFTDEEHAAPQQKLNTHAQLCKTDYVGILHCFDKLKPNCPSNANLKPNLKLNILFLWLSSICSEIWSYNSVGPKLRRWLEQNLHVITSIYEIYCFLYLKRLFYSCLFSFWLCFFLLDHSFNLLWNDMLGTPCSASSAPCPGQPKFSMRLYRQSHQLAFKKSWSLREMQTHARTHPRKPVAHAQVWSSPVKLQPGELMLHNMKWAADLSCCWRVTEFKWHTGMETWAFVCCRDVPVYLCVRVCCVIETFFFKMSY